MPTNTYVALAQQTLASVTDSVTFSSISGDYTDLVLVCNAGLTTGTPTSRLQFNGDTTSNYSTTLMYGDGSAAGAVRIANETSANTGGMAGEFGTTIIHINNYSNTTTYKTTLTRYGFIGSYSEAGAKTSLWRSTAAITSIRVFPLSSTFIVGSTFSLYGIKGQGISPAPKATGGAIYSDDTYYYHAFGATGTFTPLSSLTADILVVGGGGQGGGGNGGGGGAGGLRAFTSQSLTATGYTCTIGAGGSGGVTNNVGGSGTNSSFTGLTAAAGGGGGGGYSAGAATNGGSGGGGGTSGNTTAGSSSLPGGQGNAGGAGHATDNMGGGGGGSGAAGGVGTVTVTGTGGNGTSAYSTWGFATGVGQNVAGTYYIAGGGSGGGDAASGQAIVGAAGFGGGGLGGSEPTNALPGVANTGSGGGGEGGGGAGANGGSGVVIVRYLKV